MGTIRVHEFISLDGVIDAPTWTFDYGFDPAMGQDIGNLMSSCEAILLGRSTSGVIAPGLVDPDGCGGSRVLRL